MKSVERFEPWRTADSDAMIREALQRLGVARGKFFDEFDALGLGRHREAQGWLDET